ncbi:MAG: ABC-F family ATP-binding cassette domain-containing protein [Clostridia bacterium]|nr:ABC-F family ATP-binding cassette domain-containing protein [Clostridia bacterium]
MLHVQDLTLIHKKDLTTLMEGISFSVSPGERLALIGEEGNGKSSLLRAILRDESLDGYIEQRGRIVNSFRTGYLPQELPAACRSMSAYEYFCEDPVFYDQTPRRLGELAARLALPADVFYSEQPMSAFSGGERVKLQLARLMMRDPELLLLDEPTNDLDGDTVRFLTSFLLSCGLAVLFVSHDETLLSKAATGVILLERLRRRQVPRASVCRQGYEEFVKSRSDLFAHQAQVARKEREEFSKKMQRYNQIRQRVEHEQNAISRRDPYGSRLLKKKMHTVMSMGRRFERESQEMTAMPENEEAIFARLCCQPLPPGKVVLDLDLNALCVGERVLARNLHLCVRACEKICITGRNGAGKSTLLRHIHDLLKNRADLNVFYMPQDPGDLLDMDKTPIEMLTITGGKDEQVRSAVALGSMKFTGEEMNHPCRGLSGGQKAKLMFLMMAASGADVLLLDEPTRNLSPLSGPVIRALFDDYPGCIIAVSHDNRLISTVCSREARLTENGLELHEIG